ncbi:hypothetical protein [Shewanella sp.]|uniref:hypothetical protein n=2 Tax=Pseudomonadati TaxID=3379134 RepID=UPI0040481F8B
MAYKKSPKGTPRNTFVQKYKKYVPKPRKVIKTTATLASLARDIMIMKGLTSSVMAGLNTEKKYVDRDVVSGSFGQVDGNGPLGGYYAIDVTPSMAQGLGSANRVGNSIKLTGISLPVQFNGMDHTFSRRKIKMMLFRVSSADNGVSLTETIADYLDPNPINNLFDMNSPRAYRSHKHDGIKLIRSKTYTLPAPVQSTYGSDDLVEDVEQAGFSAKFNVKLQDILRFNLNGDVLPDGTRYYLYFFADKGNGSTTTASTQDVPIKPIKSGVEFRLGQRSWYVDN